MADMADEVVVVTGASAGIGTATALELARQGAHVVLTGRDAERLAAVSQRIDDEHPGRARHVPADFTRLEDVHALSRWLHDEYDHVHALVNNAGVFMSRHVTTVDGHEVTNQVNHLAPFLLTNLLWDLLSARDGTRVVVTGSLLAEGLDVDDLDRTRRRRAGWGAYKASKQANALFTARLATLTGPSGPVTTCCHPGMVRTTFASEARAYRTFRQVFPWLFQPVETAAHALVNLALGDDGLDHPGALFNGTRPVRRLRRWSDDALAEKLWLATETMLGMRWGATADRRKGPS